MSEQITMLKEQKVITVNLNTEKEAFWGLPGEDFALNPENPEVRLDLNKMTVLKRWALARAIREEKVFCAAEVDGELLEVDPVSIFDPSREKSPILTNYMTRERTDPKKQKPIEFLDRAGPKITSPDEIKKVIEKTQEIVNKKSAKLTQQSNEILEQGVRAVRTAIEDIDDLRLLRFMVAIEKADQERKTVIAALNKKIQKINTDTQVAADQELKEKLVVSDPSKVSYQGSTIEASKVEYTEEEEISLNIGADEDGNPTVEEVSSSK